MQNIGNIRAKFVYYNKLYIIISYYIQHILHKSFLLVIKQ